jgi:hypothetical protein
MLRLRLLLCLSAILALGLVAFVHAADSYCKPDTSKTSGCSLTICGECCRTQAWSNFQYEKLGSASSRPSPLTCPAGSVLRDFNTIAGDNTFHWRFRDFWGNDYYVRDTALCESLGDLSSFAH